MIFIKLRKKKTACKGEQIHKMTTIFTQVVILNENSCHFVNLLNFASSSQLEKNHVTQLPTAKN